MKKYAIIASRDILKEDIANLLETGAIGIPMIQGAVLKEEDIESFAGHEQIMKQELKNMNLSGKYYLTRAKVSDEEKFNREISELSKKSDLVCRVYDAN